MDIIEEKTQIFLKKLEYFVIKQKIVLHEISAINIEEGSDVFEILELKALCTRYLELQKYKNNLMDFIATLNSGNNEEGN